ncbi:polysaccharide lyase family 8 super-sandwich domain-containing protein [Propionibacteriaceae bacterium Y2011]
MQRRTVLGLGAGTVAVGMGAATGPGHRAAHAAGPEDRTRILANVVTCFAGTTVANGYAEAKPRIDAIVATARSRIKALDAAGENEVFAGLPLGSSESNLTATFTRLAEIALVTRTPGAPADLYRSEDLQLRVLDALALVHQRHYGDQAAGYYGNWFHWEIGMPTQITRALALLQPTLDDLRPGLLDTYVASMDAYLRNGVNGDVDLTSRFHTGANLADITTNRVIQGALLGDDARITKAVRDQLTVYADVDPGSPVNGVTDGFYADGSYIQHDSVAYTGQYGKSLLERSVQLLKFVAGTGTGWDRRAELVPVVHGWVAGSFAPVIFQGWLMELVKGRGVSRPAGGYADVVSIVESVTDLSTLADGEPARQLAGYVKYLVSSSRADVEPASFTSPQTIVAYAQLLADPQVVAVDLAGERASFAFNSMERNVHVRPGWAFALSRNSERISKYEYMNGENLRPWFSGEGMHQLYLGGQDQSDVHGVDHLTVVSPYGLAGTIVPVQTRRTVPQAYDGQRWYENAEAGFTSSSENQNTYVYFPRGTTDHSGGANLGPYSTATMALSDDVTWRDQLVGKIPAEIAAYPNARASRSWFMFDSEVVLLAAGISDSPDLVTPRRLRTTIDARIAEVDDDVSVTGADRNGRQVGAGSHDDLAWALWQNRTARTSVGYAFLASTPVTLSSQQQSGSRRDVRLSNPDTEVTKDVFAVEVDHPAGSTDQLAVALVPGADADRLGQYESAKMIKVLSNTEAVQAVEHRTLGITMINTFSDEPSRVHTTTIDGVASVIMVESGDLLRLAVTDPTTNRERVRIELRGRRWQLLGESDRLRSTPIPGGLRLDVDTRALHGASIPITLRRG